MRVGKDLDLHVASPLDGAFHVDPRLAEGGLNAPLRGREGRLEPLRPGDQRHPDPTPARGGLEHDRIADRVGNLPRRPRAFHRTVGTGQHRHAGASHDPARLRLVAHRP
jgi:hypothetical protein